MTLRLSEPQRRRAIHCLLATALGFALVGMGCGSDPPDPADYRAMPSAGAKPAEPCRDRSPLRRAYFGDLHVHTALSTDAWNYDVEVRPHDAYGYAFGVSMQLPPKDARGRPTRTVQIDRALDFAAVTDHAEFLGEQRLCADSESAGYDSETCLAIRASEEPIDSPLALAIANPWPSRQADLCGEDKTKGSPTG